MHGDNSSSSSRVTTVVAPIDCTNVIFIKHRNLHLMIFTKKTHRNMHLTSLYCKEAEERWLDVFVSNFVFFFSLRFFNVYFHINEISVLFFSCCMVLLLWLLQYVVEKDANTLLPQFLGMYRITVNNSETHLVVMRCVFSPLFSVHCKYDLKARRLLCWSNCSSSSSRTFLKRPKNESY